MLTWSERPQGSPNEYENAQKRILEVFTQWKAPANFKIELFVIRVGDWGGYMMLDCDDPLAVHKLCSMLPAFVFEARPVVPSCHGCCPGGTGSDCISGWAQVLMMLVRPQEPRK